MPDAGWMVQDVTCLEQNLCVLEPIRAVLLTDADTLVCLVHLILNFKIASVFEVWCVADKRRLHTWFNA